jgi:hypothetical protein
MRLSYGGAESTEDGTYATDATDGTDGTNEKPRAPRGFMRNSERDVDR